jgi:hypothetical protein
MSYLGYILAALVILFCIGIIVWCVYRLIKAGVVSWVDLVCGSQKDKE